MLSGVSKKMFWPFFIKSVAERLNSLQIGQRGITPEFNMHGANVEDIPVKSFHTLFSQIYVLDVRLQNSGLESPTK